MCWHGPGRKLDKIIAYMNFDMVASPNYIVGVYDARKSGGGGESDNANSRLRVPDGSMEIMEFFTGHFDSNGQSWIGTEWNFDSDQVAFIEEDVAVGGLFTGSIGRKSARQSELFGGAAGQPRDPNYHTAGDDISNISQEALSIMTEAITHAAISLAEDRTPLE